MSELVNKVAEILNAPVDLVQRSAEARAAASGKSVDEVLSSWAGGESVEASAPKEEAPLEEAPIVETVAVEESVVEESVEEVVQEVVEESVEEVVQEVVEEVVDLKNESSLAFISGVLSIAVFTFIFAFLTPKNQSISIVESSLNNTVSVSTTFPTCADHAKWIQLGSAGWQAEVGPTYGAEDTVSIGGMPGFQGKLTEDELYAVVVFERVVFGGGNTEEVLIDCGLIETEEEEVTTEAVSP